MKADINNLLGITEHYKAPDRIMEILHNPSEANKVFMDFLDSFNYDLSYDWFHEYFEDEHADRNKKKQDFTPKSLSDLVGAILNPSGIIYEPAAGTGGMITRAWNQHRQKYSSFDYDPMSFWVVAEEMSERALPFLLFNLMVRGINGNVLHINTLTRECRNVYFVYNQTNDCLGFSTLYVQPRVKALEDCFGIKFMGREVNAG